MIGSCHLLKVLNPIIVTHPVDVVYHLTPLYHIGWVGLVPNVMASLDTPTIAVPQSGRHPGRFGRSDRSAHVAAPNQPLTTIPAVITLTLQLPGGT